MSSPYQELLDAIELNTQSNYQLSQLVGELTDALARTSQDRNPVSEVRADVRCVR